MALTRFSPPASSDLLRNFCVIVLGFLFALGLYQVWDLSTRWIVIIFSAIALVGLSMMFVARFGDFLMVSLFFAIPLASFQKWFGLKNIDEQYRGAHVYGGWLGVGAQDFLIIGLLVAWYCRVYILNVQAPPKWMRADYWVLLLLLAYVLSVPGTDHLKYGLYATIYLVKHIALYFLLSRNLQRRHIPWLAAAVLVAIIGETGLGAIQHIYDKWVGIALDKGAGSGNIDYQYSVPGAEDFTRATGTTYDSHALGLFMSMLMMLPLVMMFVPRFKMELKLLSLAILLMGFGTLLLSYSRSGWAAFGITVIVLVFLIPRGIKGAYVTPMVLLGLAVVVATSPWVVHYIFERFEKSPWEVMQVRFGMYETAAHIWSKFPLFGYGVGNYMEALHNFDMDWSDDLPVHDVPLWIAAETGLFGLIAFFGIVFGAMRRLWRVAHDEDPWLGALGLSGVGVLMAYLIDGIFDPMFREPDIYQMFWLYVAAGAAFAPAVIVVPQPFVSGTPMAESDEALPQEASG